MKTYIRKSIKGYYVTFPEEIDSNYWAGQIGSTLDEFYAGKWVLLSDEQVAFHVEYPHASISEVWNMKINEYIEPERTLEQAIQEKIYQIEQYDNSDSVNSFTIVLGDNSMSAWLTPNQRANYKNSVDAAKLVGLEELHPVFNGIQLTLPTATAEMALAQIQLYADRCFIVTETHKAEVQALESIEAVDNYDITSGYPEKLTFNV